jgi:hypothetical protein
METIGMSKNAFGVDSASEAQIKFWYRRLKDGWESVESDPHIWNFECDSWSNVHV